MFNTKREQNIAMCVVITIGLLYMTSSILQYLININCREQIQELRSRVEKLEAGREPTE